MVKSKTVRVQASYKSTSLSLAINPGSGPPIPQSATGFLKSSGVPLDGKPVDLYYSAGAGEVYYGRYTTLSDGSYGFYNIAVQEKTYTWSAVFGGDSVYGASNKSVTTTFARGATALSISITPLSGAVPLDVTISGVLTRVDKGTPLSRDVTVYKDDVALKTVRTGGQDGKYSVGDTLLKPKSYDYYAMFDGDEWFKGCRENLSPKSGSSRAGLLILLALLAAE